MALPPFSCFVIGVIIHSHHKTELGGRSWLGTPNMPSCIPLNFILSLTLRAWLPLRFKEPVHSQLVPGASWPLFRSKSSVSQRVRLGENGSGDFARQPAGRHGDRQPSRCLYHPSQAKQPWTGVCCGEGLGPVSPADQQG